MPTGDRGSPACLAARRRLQRGAWWRERTLATCSRTLPTTKATLLSSQTYPCGVHQTEVCSVRLPLVPNFGTPYKLSPLRLPGHLAPCLSSAEPFHPVSLQRAQQFVLFIPSFPLALFHCSRMVPYPHPPATLRLLFPQRLRTPGQTRLLPPSKTSFVPIIDTVMSISCRPDETCGRGHQRIHYRKC